MHSRGSGRVPYIPIRMCSADVKSAYADAGWVALPLWADEGGAWAAAAGTALMSEGGHKGARGRREGKGQRAANGGPGEKKVPIYVVTSKVKLWGWGEGVLALRYLLPPLYFSTRGA